MAVSKILFFFQIFHFFSNYLYVVWTNSESRSCLWFKSEINTLLHFPLHYDKMKMENSVTSSNKMFQQFSVTYSVNLFALLLRAGLRVSQILSSSENVILANENDKMNIRKQKINKSYLTYISTIIWILINTFNLGNEPI